MFFNKKIKAGSCGHQHCVKVRFHNDGNSKLHKGWAEYMAAMEAEPDQVEAHRLRFSAEYLSPALLTYPSIKQFAERYGPGSINPSITGMECNGDLLVHLSFRSDKALKRFTAMSSEIAFDRMSSNMPEEVLAAMREHFPNGLPEGMIVKNVSGMSLADFPR